MRTKPNLRTLTLALLCIVLSALPGMVLGRTVYVDAATSGRQDGSSWAAAFRYLEDALAIASAGDEIRMAQGVYHAARIAPGTQITTGHIEATFRLVDGVVILGGFAGPGGADPDLRDPARFATILNGDLGGNDDDLNNERRWYDNTKHIITAKNVGSDTVLDGLTITHGYAYGDHGGGMYNEGGSPLVRDCTFHNNGAGDGGVYNNKGNLRIEHCRFIHNWADDHSGALRNYEGSLQVIASEFVENESVDDAAAVHNDQGQAVLFGCLFRANRGSDGPGATWNSGRLSLLYCTFVDNDGGEDVGALRCTGGSAVIANCLFCRNTGEGVGAMFVEDASVSLSQCTFYSNVATDGRAGGIYYPATYCPTATFCVPSGTFTVRSCIFWANRALDDDGTDRVMGYAAQINVESNAATVEYNCIEGWTPEHGGTGNLSVDPLFVAPDQNDFHLKSQAGRWDTVLQAWVPDDVTSPCIDAGDPLVAVEHELFPNGGIVNMGAYGGTCEASKSWFGTEPSATLYAADLNGDGRVDAEDYRLAALRWPEVDQ